MKHPITVIYNDTCPICSREVNAYKTRTDATAVRYHGVSEGGLDAFGLDEDRAARQFHVIEGEARHEGVAAFAALWARIPSLRWLSWLVTRPLIRPIADAVYGHVLAPVLYGLHRRRLRRLQKPGGKLG